MQGWHTTSDRQAGIRQPAVALSPNSNRKDKAHANITAPTSAYGVGAVLVCVQRMLT
jgi:hypothetical protein